MSYKIPLFDLNFTELEKRAVLETIESNWISTGPRCLEFEQKFAKMLNANYAISVSNCTTALHLAYEVLDIGPGDEVICPSMSFVATVNAIRYVNAVPVFCDVKGIDDLNLDPEKIERLVTEKTKAIVVMHFAGFPCDMDSIMTIAHKYKLRVVEDACHGPLSEYKGRKLGTIGDIGCFSFFSNKNISTGEGGMMVTNDKELEKQIRLKRSHGMTTMSFQRASGHSTEYDVVALGYNYRMDDLRASLGIVQLDKLQDDLERRRNVRSWYENKLQKLSEKVVVPFQNNREFVSNYVFPIVLKDSNKQYRDDVRNKMHALGVQTSVHYPAIHRFSIYHEFAKNRNMQWTEYIADNEITLPMYANLTESNIDFIVECLQESL